MHRILTVSLFLAVVHFGVSGETLQSENTFPAKSIYKFSGKFKSNRDITNGTKRPSFVQEAEVVPNYLPTGFHDFISSNQGPTYSYDSTGVTAQSQKFRPVNSLSQSYSNMHQFYPASYFYSMPEDRFTQNSKYNVAKPFQWYPANFKNRRHQVPGLWSEDRLAEGGATNPPRLYSVEYSQLNNKYPIPEDRLPLQTSEENDDEIKIQSAKFQVAENGKTRRARFVRNFLENKAKPNWSWNKRSGIGYHPQNDFYTIMPDMKNLVDRGDHFTDPWAMDFHDGDLPMIDHDPLALAAAAFLPLSIIMAAVLPTLVKLKMSGIGGNNNVPLITTTATGNKTLIGKMLNLRNAQYLDESGTFGPRTNDECILRAMCNMLGSDEPHLLSLKKAVSEIPNYVDGYWIDTFGLRTLTESVNDGNCERIRCSKPHKDANSNPPGEQK